MDVYTIRINLLILLLCTKCKTFKTRKAQTLHNTNDYQRVLTGKRVELLHRLGSGTVNRLISHSNRLINHRINFLTLSH